MTCSETVLAGSRCEWLHNFFQQVKQCSEVTLAHAAHSPIWKRHSSLEKHDLVAGREQSQDGHVDEFRHLFVLLLR